MVFSNNGKVDFEGKTYELLSEVVTLIRSLKDEGVINDDDIQEIARLSTISKEEIKKEAQEMVRKAFMDLMGDNSDDSDETFKDIFGDLL